MGDSSPGTIKSDETLLSILESLYEQKEATLSEIADVNDVSKSTIHRHLTTLVKHGYVNKEGTEYSLGHRFLDFGGVVRTRNSVHRQVKQLVHNIAEQTGEVVGYVVEEDGIGTYFYYQIGNQGVNNDIRVGRQVYLHQSAAGKAILANLQAKRVDEIIDAHGLPKRTEHTVTDREELMDDLEEIRNRGYALALEEHTEGMLAVGVPVHYSDESVAGGIVIAAPIHRMEEDKLKSEFPQLLIGMVQEFELNFLYS